MTGRIFQPFAIGPFAILPEGTTGDGGLPIVLGRKGAFGSGEHETTAACLELLAALPSLAGARVLDLGSGTGILAVAAARLGAAHLVALDNDWRAALSCQDNVRLNDLDDAVRTVCGELSCLGAASFDLLLANIYAEVHLALADRMAEVVRPGGHLLLSGIPLQDKFDIQRRFAAAGCTELDSRIGEDFATFLFRRD